MSPRRRLAAVLLAVLLAGAGCGSGTPSPEGLPEVPGSEDLAGQRVEVAAVWSGVESRRFRVVLDRFEEATGARVRFTSAGDDLATVLDSRLAAGQAPEVAVLPQPGLLAALARRGALQPLPAAAVALVETHYDPLWRDLAQHDGRLYGVWFKASNKSTVWFNRAVLARAGVAPPATWDGFQAAAAALHGQGIVPLSVGGADGWTLTDWFENVYLRTAGPDAYRRLAAHQMPWTDPTVRQALHTLAQVLGRPEWLRGGTRGALEAGFADSVSRVFADPPEAAMVFEGDFVASVVAAGTDAEPARVADFFDFPAIGPSPPAVVAGGGDVAVLLSDTPAARALVTFLATPGAGEVWAALGGFSSPNRGVDLSVYPDDVARRAARALVEADVVFDLSDLQPPAFGGTPGQGLWKLLQEFVADPGAIDHLTAEIETAAIAAYASAPGSLK
ncbi:MAG: ABC transporter substrate-binding protein [Acidimicrobiia bacterium]